jgi:valyl-tRNA synthetase
MNTKYDYQLLESTIQQQWETDNTYGMDNNSGPVYSIDTPPPTVSGKLHIGHIFSYTQTDIIARYKRMSGYSVFYPFGFDDNGLPTERYVEKKCGIRGNDMPRSEFIALCIQESLDAAEQFKTLWQRMGLSVDWSKVYSTISDSSRQISQKSFIDLLKKQYIYRKQEPALYCATCRTSVAQAELDDKEVSTFFNDVIFKDAQGNDLVIATTRPELLSGCLALLYHPDDKRYQHLRSTHATVPLFGQKVPILEDELVQIDKGTGLVMVCTFGDTMDILWYKKHHLPYRQMIGFDGKFTQDAGFLQGLKVADARQAVLERLKENGLLVAQKPIMHSVNVHERCKKEIEFVIIPQWFISILPYKQEFLAIADTINWYPAFMKSRYVDWVENLAWDWGISRQRFYGIPFPVWHCKQCSAILLADEAQLPIDPQETAYNKPCTECGGTDIVPDTDVMDTWNTSSLTPYICNDLYSNATLPLSMRPQAHDIIRTWAFDTIVKTWMHDKVAPWKDIVISGHVLSSDKKGKISKKDANASMEPEQLLTKYSADAIRYWTASAKLGHDISFSDEQLVIGQKLITKLWNAFKFAEPHLQQFTTPDNRPESISVVNQWLLHAISKCADTYMHYCEKHEIGLALSVVEKFFWQDYCDNYIELIKNQLFNPELYTEQEVYATRWTLYHVGLRILQLYAPYLPHITDIIYQEFYKKYQKKSSIHQVRYADIQIQSPQYKDVQSMSDVIYITASIRKFKSDNRVSLKTPIACLTLCVSNQEVEELLCQHEQLIKGVTQSSSIEYKYSLDGDSYFVCKDDQWYASIVISNNLKELL